MTSFEENLLSDFSITKLPVISNSGLITAGIQTQERRISSSWAANIRRQIDHAVNRNVKPHSEDVVQLHQEIIKLIIQIIRKPNLKNLWYDLCDALHTVNPYINYLSSGFTGRISLSYQVQHYIDRLFVCYQQNKDKLQEIPIMEKIQEVYPNEYDTCKEKYGNSEMPVAQISQIKSPEIIKPPKSPNKTSVRQIEPIIQKRKDPERFFKPPKLTMDKLSNTIGKVAEETVTKESVWKSEPSSTVAAVNIDFPRDYQQYTERASTITTESLFGDRSEAGLDILEDGKIKEPPFHSITGLQAVEQFLSDRHLNKVKFIYLNVAENKYFRPYDLVSVPQNKVKSEHYVFSTFGVLHVVPGGTKSETMTLAEWNREALLWSIVSKIPFFSDFLQAKVFLRWKNNVRRRKLARMRRSLQLNLLHLVPEFGSALLHIMRLIQELSQVNLLPRRDRNHQQFTLNDFKIEHQKRVIEAENKLELFFRFCKKVITVTRQQCFDQLKFFEYQMKHKHKVFTKESLYIQRKKAETRVKNFERARHVTQLLSNFVMLVDQIISVSLVAVVRDSVNSYVYGLLSLNQDIDAEARSLEDIHAVESTTSKALTSDNSVKDDSTIKTTLKLDLNGSVFTSKLVFNVQTNGLELSPSPQELKDGVFALIHGIINVSCKKAYSMSPANFKPVVEESEDGTDEDGLTSTRSSVSSLSSYIQEYPSVPVDQSNGEMQNSIIIDTADEDMQEPEMPTPHFPTKESDNYAVATPNFIPTPGDENLANVEVKGHGIMGQFSPLDPSKLKNKFYQDEEISQAIQYQSDLMDSALREVELFCLNQNLWLVTIRSFCVQWSKEKLLSHKGKPAREIEDILNQLKSWTDTVKNMERSLLTKNRLLFVDCRIPQMKVVPALSQIFKQIINLVTAEIKDRSISLTTEARDALKALEKKELSMKSFASYARKVSESQKKKSAMADNVMYIKSLQEVVRMTYRQLTHDEEKQSEKVKSAWEAFVFQLKDASNFVNNQRPLILKQLDALYENQKKIAEDLLGEACSGVAVDPTQDPNVVIANMKQVSNEFMKCKIQLADLSHCRESITEEDGFDLSWVKPMEDKIGKRHELWKSMYATDQTIQGWNATLFRRFNAKNAMEKVDNWMKICNELEEELPPDDPVIQSWKKRITEFSKELPCFEMLANEAVKGRHWKKVFTGMGESFESDWTFTVEDLLSYKLSEHTDVVNQVYHSSVAEYNLEILLKKIKNIWNQRQYHLAKHIHTVKRRVSSETAQKNKSSNSNNSNQKKKSSGNVTTTTIVYQEQDTETYILIDYNELLSDLNDSHMQLQSMLQSKHATEVRDEVEIWSDTLQQIGEIVNLWISCQDKWMYLTHVFAGDINLSTRFKNESQRFGVVDRQYREFINTMLIDASILSVLSRRHGQPGWRELQGEALRKHLVVNIQLEEEILQNISELLQEFRTQFPRLYFLSNEDCVRLLGISRQPRALMPYARRCFSGIGSLVYTLPDQNNSDNALNRELLSHRLQVTQVIGFNNEVIELCEPLESQSDATAWLQQLEILLQQTLQSELDEIIKEQFTLESASVPAVLEELENIELQMIDSNNAPELKHGLLRYPTQINLLFDSAKWVRRAAALLKNGFKEDGVKEYLKELLGDVKKYCNLLQDVAIGLQKSNARKRLYYLLMSLTEQAIYHRDVLKMLTSMGATSESTYEWQRLIKHTMNVSVYKQMKIPEPIFKKQRPMEVEIHGFSVEQFDNGVLYGFEYDSSLRHPTVTTPLLERSMFSLSTSMRLVKCGTLIGDSETGKSEALSQLARLYGKQIINFNCSQDVTVPVLCRTLAGAVESGSWLCFDQANKLDQNVLSLLCQQILHVQRAYEVLQSSKHSEYTRRGKQIEENTGSIKRSNSITSLHPDAPVSYWNPEISSHHLIRMCKFRETDDTYMHKLYQRESTRIQDEYLGNMTLNGQLLKAKSNLGLFMTMTPQLGTPLDIPYNMKLMYRPISAIKPDLQKIIEVLLTCIGCTCAIEMSKKLELASNIINGNADIINMNAYSNNGVNTDEIKPFICEAGQLKIATISLSTLKSIIHVTSLYSAVSQSQQSSRVESVAGDKSESSSASGSMKSVSVRSEMQIASHNYELALVNAILVVLTPKMNSPLALSRLKDLLRVVFPLAGRPVSAKTEDHRLIAAIEQQFAANGLQVSKELTDKICQLNATLKINKCVVLTGAAGCGKTTMYQILSKAINKLVKENEADFKRKFLSLSGSRNQSQMQAESSMGRISSELLMQSGNSNVYYIAKKHGLDDLIGKLYFIGILEKLLKGNYEHGGDIIKGSSSASCEKWLIMDGEIQPDWVENLYCLIDNHNKAYLPTFNDIQLNSSNKVIFEIVDFDKASPALVSRCGIITCNPVDQWKLLVASWMSEVYGRYSVTLRTIQIWKELVESMFASTIEFIEAKCTMVENCNLPHFLAYSSSSKGIHEVSSFLRIFESLLNEHMKRRGFKISEKTESLISKNQRSQSVADTLTDAQSTVTFASSARSRLDDNIPDSHHHMALNLFTMSFVWGFGGHLAEDDMIKFDEFIRTMLAKSRYDVKFPPYETVFDYFVDEESGKLILWEDKVDLRPRVLPQGSTYSFVPQLERYAYLSTCLLKSHSPLLLIGAPGCGKTSFVQNLLQPEIKMARIPVSQGLTTAHLQKLIESKTSPFLKQHNLGLMAHPSAIIATRTETKHRAVFFIDDLSCARMYSSKTNNNVASIQPINELIRQILSVKGVYDRDRLLFKTLEGDVNFIATAVSPGHAGTGTGSCNAPIHSRIARYFTKLHLTTPSKDMLLSIYHSGVQSWLEEFPAYSLSRHYDLSQAIISGSYDLWMTIKSHLKPSPLKAHYVFNLHDIANLMQGLYLLHPRNRGRPRPMRMRPDRDAGKQMRRPGGGRMRQTRNWGDSLSVPPMMRTIVRTWLHECTRTFYDRLTDDHDRHWFSRSLQDLLKKHFCTAKDERAVSPAIERVRLIKTPIPSSGTPLPYMEDSSSGSNKTYEVIPTSEHSESTFNLEESGTSAPENSVVKQQSSLTTTQDNDLQSTSSAGVIRLTPSALLQANQDYELEFAAQDEQANSTLETGSRLPMDILSLQDNSDKRFSTGTEEAVQQQIEIVESSDQSTTKHDSETVDLEEGEKSSSGNKTASDDYLSEASKADNLESEATSVYAESGNIADDEASRTVTRATEVTEATTEYDSDTSETSCEKTTTSETTATDTSSTKTKTVSKSATTTEVLMQSDNEFLKPSSGVKPKFQESPGKIARPGGAKLGVTFVPGLIDDPDRQINTAGPLIPYNQVLDPGEDPTGIILSHISPQRAAVDSYAEGNESQIGQILELAQQAYNSSRKDDSWNLVFFKDAIHHAARLSRIIGMSHGNAVLFSKSNFTGRKSLVRIVAYLFKARVFEATKYNENENKNKQQALRKIIKSASFKAGIEKVPVVLIIDETYSTDVECMDDIGAVVREGQCSALYSHDELAVIGSQTMPGSSVTTGPDNRSLSSTLEKLDKYLNKFFDCVKQHLHIVLLMKTVDMEGEHETTNLQQETDSNYFHNRKQLKNFHQILLRCPDIVKRFQCFDFYESFNHTAWMQIADKWLTTYTGYNDDFNVNKPSLAWPSDISMGRQVTNLSHLMAHIHIDAKKRVYAKHISNMNKFVTPDSYRMLSVLFVNIASKIKSEEKKSLKRYETVMEKIKEAEETVKQYHAEKKSLIPELDTAIETQRSWKKHVEQERKEYLEAKQRCLIEEEIIEQLDSELIILREDSQVAFNKVNPKYEAALQTLSSLDSNAIGEIKRYKVPPTSAVLVVQCLCAMFDVPSDTWETGVALIMQDNFFQELEYYNKEKIPQHIYIKIKEFVKMQEFQPEEIAKGSKAAASLCAWVHAVYNYAKVTRYLAPKIALLKSTEVKLVKAQAVLGVKRVRCNQIKEELDAKIEQHRQAKIMVKKLEKRLKQLEELILKAETLLGNLEDYVVLWRKLHNQTLSRLETSIGDSLLTAACVVYHSVLPPNQQKYSLDQWKQACVLGYYNMETESFEMKQPKDVSDEKKVVSAASSRMKSVSTLSDSDSILSWSDEGRTEDTMSRESKRHHRPLALIRDDFDPSTVIMEDELLLEWYKNGLPKNYSARKISTILLHLTVNQTLKWPLIYDSDDEFHKWIKFTMKSVPHFYIAPEESEATSSSQLVTESVCRSSSETDETGATSETSETEETENMYTTDDEDNGTTISVTTTSQTIKSSSGSSRSKTRAESQKSKVRFADDEYSEGDDRKIEQESSEELTQNIDSVQQNIKSGTGTPTYKIPRARSSISEDVEIFFEVCEADDANLPNCLTTAASVGSFIFITNFERISRRNLDILLLFKNELHRHTDDLPNSMKQFADTNFTYHENFKLFVVMGTSLEFDALPSFIVDAICSFQPLDFSITLEGLEEKLLQIVLSQEKGEFEAHQKLMESDIFHLQENFKNLQRNLLTKVIDIKGPILEDDNLLHTIQTCKREEKGTNMTLEETKMLEASLMLRKADLTTVAIHGCLLYENLQKVCVMNPSVYYWPTERFIELFTKSLQAHVRGKPSQNQTMSGDNALKKSRVTELNQGVTEELIQQLQLTMNPADVLAFTTMVVFSILQKEEKISDAETKSYFGRGQIQDSAMKSTKFQKPNWLSHKAWKRVVDLERKHAAAFANITTSISKRSRKWQEYFNSPLPFISKLPCDTLQHLSIGQQALLWITVFPELTEKVSRELCKCVLGSTATKKSVWNIDSLVQNTQHYRPLVFFNTVTDHVLLPSAEVINLAREKKIEVIERTAPFFDELSDIMQECMLEGHWMLLYNTELEAKWPEKFIVQLNAMAACCSSSVGKQNAKEQENRAVGDKSLRHSISTTTSEDVSELDIEETVEVSESINPNFRLWIFANTDKALDKLILPSAIHQHAVFVNSMTPECHQKFTAKTFYGLEKYAKTLAPFYEEKDVLMLPHELERMRSDEKKLYMQVAMLHVILHQRNMYKPFTQCGNSFMTDMDAYLLLKLLLQNNSPNSLKFENTKIARDFLGASTTNESDMETLQFFIEEVLGENFVRKQNLNLMRECQILRESIDKPQKGFDKLAEEIDLNKLDLPPHAEKFVSKSQSKNFRNSLYSISEQAEIQVQRTFTQTDNLLSLSAAEIQMKRHLDNLMMQIAEINVPFIQNMDGPLNTFYHAELTRINTILMIAKHDLTLVLMAVKGFIEMNSYLLQLIDDLTQDKIPHSWIHHYSDIFIYLAYCSPTALIDNLRNTTASVNAHVEANVVKRSQSNENSSQPSTKTISSSSQTSIPYNLSHFIRPDVFLQSFKSQVARVKYTDAHKIKLHAEILPTFTIGRFTMMEKKDEEFIEISGLNLHNAHFNAKNKLLQSSLAPKPCGLPIVRITATKITTKPQKPEDNVMSSNIVPIPVCIAGNPNKKPLICVNMHCEVNNIRNVFISIN